MNQRLAAFYGIPNVEGPQFRRVDLPPDSHRGGILTQASVLTVSSYPARTSPVLRGKWILQNLLDSPPPPPPPNVPTLDETALAPPPPCANGWSSIAPIRRAKVVTPAWTRWVSILKTTTPSATGELTMAISPSTRATAPTPLKQILLKDQDRFARCLASKLMTYALGRKCLIALGYR